MLLPNQEAFYAFKESCEGVKTLKIHTVGEDMENILTLLNQVRLLDTNFTLKVEHFNRDAIAIKIASTGTIKRLTAQEFIESLPVTAVPIGTEHTTAKSTLSGLVYNHMLEAPLYYSRATNTLLKSSTEPVPVQDTARYLNNCVNLYEKHLKEFMPAVHVLETNRVKVIRKSLESRGFSKIPAIGDRVKLLDYAEMVSMYGEDTETIAVPFIKAQNSTYGIPFIKPLEILCGKEGVIKAFNKTTGIIEVESLEDGKNIFNVRDEDIGLTLDRRPLFHESQFRKIEE